MPRGFGRLPFLTRRSTTSDGRPGETPTAVAAAADPDAAPVGPPVLLPASIVSQVLFQATELTPVWARPRTEPEPVPVAAQPVAQKRARRAPAGGAAAKAAATAATPRRPRAAKRSAKSDE